MEQTVITNYTVVDTDSSEDQMGFRNFINARNEEYVEVRVCGRLVAELRKEDFKKFLLCAERIADLLVIEEKNSENKNA